MMKILMIYNNDNNDDANDDKNDDDDDDDEDYCKTTKLYLACLPFTLYQRFLYDAYIYIWFYVCMSLCLYICDDIYIYMMIYIYDSKVWCLDLCCGLYYLYVCWDITCLFAAIHDFEDISLVWFMSFLFCFCQGSMCCRRISKLL